MTNGTHTISLEFKGLYIDVCFEYYYEKETIDTPTNEEFNIIEVVLDNNDITSFCDFSEFETELKKTIIEHYDL